MRVRKTRAFRIRLRYFARSSVTFKPFREVPAHERGVVVKTTNTTADAAARITLRHALRLRKGRVAPPGIRCQRAANGTREPINKC